MTASALPDFERFNPDVDIASLAINWKKWTVKLENLFVALNIENPTRKKAVLLYYDRDRLSDIYTTLGDTAETNVAAKEVLDQYFEHKKNLTYEVYKFRKLLQNEDESINSYISREYGQLNTVSAMKNHKP